MTVEINIAEWMLYLIVIYLSIALADNTLSLYKKYLEWKIENFKNNSKPPHTEIKKDK